MTSKYSVLTDAGREIPLKVMNFPSGEVNVKLEVNPGVRFPIKNSVTVSVQGYDSNTLFVLACIKNALDDLFVRSDVEGKVYLFMPYVPNARYDRHMVDGDSFGLEVFASMLNLIGFHRIIVADPHSDQTKALIKNCVVIPQHVVVLDTLADWQKEQNECRSEVEINPDDGSVRKDWQGKPKRKFKFEPIQWKRVYHVRRVSDKRVETYTANAEVDFSLFDNMAPQRLEKETLFIIEDRFQKNGAKKMVGQAAILREIANKFNQDTNETDGRMFLMDSKQQILDLAKLHHYPEDKLRIYKMSDFEYAYVPKKAVRGQVKLWQSINGSDMREVKVGLDDYDVPQYYVRAEGHKLVSSTLREDYMELSDQVKLLSRVVPTEHVFMFRKTVWDKIPEDWVEIDVALIEKLVKSHPEWWIEHNRHQTARHCSGKRVSLANMQVRLRTSIRDKMVTDGHVDTLRDRVTPDPKGVNFEDNMEVIQEFFGRPQIIFADSFYPMGRYGEGILQDLCQILPKECKLKKSIECATVRAKKNFDKEKVRSANKNCLLSWIDWGKVSFREVAEHLGHTLTPYVEKQ